MICQIIDTADDHCCWSSQKVKQLNWKVAKEVIAISESQEWFVKSLTLRMITVVDQAGKLSNLTEKLQRKS